MQSVQQVKKENEEEMLAGGTWSGKAAAYCIGSNKAGTVFFEN